MPTPLDQPGQTVLDLGCATLVALVLLGCAGRTEPSSTLEPSLGRSQPLSTPAPSSATPVAEPTVTEPTVSEPAVTESTEPSSTEPAIPPPAAPTEIEDDLCRHITAVVLSESKDAAELTGEQVDELIASCSVALAQDRRKLGEAEFRRRADCVLSASSVAEFSACQPRAGNPSGSR